MGYKIVSPEPGAEPEEAPLRAAKVELWFNDADWGWINDVQGHAHLQDRYDIKEQTIIREAVAQLAKLGGWSELRDALLRRDRLEPKAGRSKGSRKAT